MSNIEKAIKLIGTLADGDTTTAADLLSDSYIEHDVRRGPGKADFLALVTELGADPKKTTVENIRAFEDGDKVFLQSVYDIAGGGKQVYFDIFRFDKDGKIVEHWDAVTDVAPPNPSGRTQTDGTTEKKDKDKTEENRKVVEGFLDDVLEGHHPDKMDSYYNGDYYIQHNVMVPDGVSGLKSTLAELGKKGITMVYNKVYQVLADGNYVLGVSEGAFGGEPTCYYDLFRIEDGKIAEHWDIMEPITDKSTWKNSNGMF